MRIAIIGKKESGKTYFAKELIKKTEIKNLIWITDKIDEVPLLEDFTNLEDIFFMQEFGVHNYNITNSKINVIKSLSSKKETIIVCDVSRYSNGLKQSIFELADEKNNIIITLPDEVDDVEDKIKNFDEIYDLNNKYQSLCML